MTGVVDVERRIDCYANLRRAFHQTGESACEIIARLAVKHQRDTCPPLALLLTEFSPSQLP